MRSVLYRRHGRASEVLETVEVAEPPAPNADEVSIRVLSRPVHHGDLLGIAGRYRSGDDVTVPAAGIRVGFEGFGVVERTGGGVDLPVGTRVAFFPRGAAWSERAVVPAAYVTRIPDEVSDNVAAQLHVNPLTAALLARAVRRAGVVPGQDAVVLSAAGSAVAKLTASVLREAGIDVVAVVRSSSGFEELRRLVGGMPVVSTESADWTDQLVSASGGKPIKAVLDPVGGRLAGDLFAMLANGGSLVSYGDLSGEPIAVPALAFSTRDLRIFGVTVGSWAGLPQEQRTEDLRLALRLASDNPPLFPVAGRYDLADVREAAAHVERPGKAGVVLLTSL